MTSFFETARDIVAPPDLEAKPMTKLEQQRRDFQVDYLAHMKARLADPDLAPHVANLYRGAVARIERDLASPNPETDERLERRRAAGFQ